MSSPTFRLSRTAKLAALAAACALTAPAAAAACDPHDLKQTLLPFQDQSWYTPTKNSSFESGANQWSVAGASVVSASDPWKIGGSADQSSLAIRSGGTATSDHFCIRDNFPHFRFFAKASSPQGAMAIDLQWLDHGWKTARAATLSAGAYGQWRLSDMTPLASLVEKLKDCDLAIVKIKFTNIGTGDWNVDDVLNDPYRRG